MIIKLTSVSFGKKIKFLRNPNVAIKSIPDNNKACSVNAGGSIVKKNCLVGYAVTQQNTIKTPKFRSKYTKC